MKKIAVLFVLLLTGFSVSAQKDSTAIPPYKRFPTVPPFRLLLPDSSTYFTKAQLSRKKPMMLMLFSPDCDHCKMATGEIVSQIGSLKSVEIVMSTTLPFEKMVDFYKQYGLDRFDNIKMGRDENYMLPVFFDIHTLPFLAFYDKKKTLISVFPGWLPVEKALVELGK